jgi:hypothetical protein
VLDGQWHKVNCLRDGTQIIETVDGANSSFMKATGSITVTDPIRLGPHDALGRSGGAKVQGRPGRVSYSIG